MLRTFWSSERRVQFPVVPNVNFQFSSHCDFLKVIEWSRANLWTDQVECSPLTRWRWRRTFPSDCIFFWPDVLSCTDTMILVQLYSIERSDRKRPSIAAKAEIHEKAHCALGQAYGVTYICSLIDESEEHCGAWKAGACGEAHGVLGEVQWFPRDLSRRCCQGMSWCAFQDSMCRCTHLRPEFSTHDAFASKWVLNILHFFFWMLPGRAFFMCVKIPCGTIVRALIKCLMLLTWYLQCMNSHTTYMKCRTILVCNLLFNIPPHEQASEAALDIFFIFSPSIDHKCELALGLSSWSLLQHIPAAQSAWAQSGVLLDPTRCNTHFFLQSAADSNPSCALFQYKREMAAVKTIVGKIDDALAKCWNLSHERHLTLERHWKMEDALAHFWGCIAQKSRLLHRALLRSWRTLWFSAQASIHQKVQLPWWDKSRRFSSVVKKKFTREMSALEITMTGQVRQEPGVRRRGFSRVLKC